MKIKSYYPVLASWILTLLFCGTEVGVRFYGFPKWMDLSNLSEWVTMFFGLIILGGPILSLLWGVGGLIEAKKKMDFILALALSVMVFPLCVCVCSWTFLKGNEHVLQAVPSGLKE